MTLLPSAFHFKTPTPSTSTSSSSYSSSFTSGSSPIPPPGTHLIISDTPQASSDFAVYSLIASGIREKRPVTIVDFQARGRLHWESVGKKIGTPFPPKTSTSTPTFTSTSTSSLLNYLAPGPETLFETETDEPTLTGLWDELLGVGVEDARSGSIRENEIRVDAETQDPIRTKGDGQRDGMTTTTIGNRRGMEKGKEEGMILLVGFSELIYQGFTPEHLARFGRALLGWCRQTQTSLITSLHTPLLLNASSLGDHLSISPSSDPESDLLLRLLRAAQDGGIWWRVEELKSGRSGVVHGEISVHPLSSRSSAIQQRIPYTSPLQYRLDDNAVRVFPKGTGRGYL